ncbi:MAG: hypothetical protein FJ119_10315 [Deltaproteobacteria bacterium]|nr:hypothetical protein [Deltaproteobacteria bacterium]
MPFILAIMQRCSSAAGAALQRINTAVAPAGGIDAMPHIVIEGKVQLAKSYTSGKAGGLKHVNRSKRIDKP